jgi:hypothetical protein
VEIIRNTISMNSHLNISLFVFAALLLITSCSRTRVLTSTYTPTPIAIDGSLNDWPADQLQVRNNPEYDLYFSNDDEFLYVYLAFKNNQFYQDVQRYGLTVFFDSDRKFRRSFGIMYPTGILNVLSDMPGARKEYLENPGWENLPENKRMIESIEENMPNRVMLIQRVKKNDPVRPIPVSMDALRAQDLHLHMDRSINQMNIEMKIPLQTTRARQFAIDPDNNEIVHFGIEVTPPSLSEIMGEDYRNEQMTTSTRDPYGNNMRQQQSYRSTSQLQLRGEFSRWNKIRLEKP